MAEPEAHVYAEGASTGSRGSGDYRGRPDVERQDRRDQQRRVGHHQAEDLEMWHSSSRGSSSTTPTWVSADRRIPVQARLTRLAGVRLAERHEVEESAGCNPPVVFDLQGRRTGPDLRKAVVEAHSEVPKDPAGGGDHGGRDRTSGQNLSAMTSRPPGAATRAASANPRLPSSTTVRMRGRYTASKPSSGKSSVRGPSSGGLGVLSAFLRDRGPV